MTVNRSQSPTAAGGKTLPAMLDDHTTTTVCKVNGGLSTTRHRNDFEADLKFCASFNLFALDSSTLTFIEKIITGRQSPNTTDN